MRNFCLLVCGLTLLLATGCGVQGRWHLADTATAGAAEAGMPARLSLNRDHSYELLTAGPAVATERGTWKYCCCRKELALTSAGQTRTMKAVRSCRQLTLDLPEADGPGQVILTRCSHCDPCPLPDTHPVDR